MASLFYKRYVPPPKAPKVVAKNDEQSSPELETSSPLPWKHSKGKEKALKKKLDSHHSSEKLAKRPKKEHKLSEQRVISPQPQFSANDNEPKELSPQIEDPPPIEKHGLIPLPQPAQAAKGPRVSVTSALPDWIRNPRIVSASASLSFTELSLSESISINLQKGNFSRANGLQSAILPMLNPRHRGPERYFGDICISAATGSGKTLAYALPLIESLRNKPVTRLRGLIVVPTRELVSQARETLEMCAAGNGIKIGTAKGSKALKEEQDALVQKGQRWDPVAYKAEQEKEADEDEELMNWDFDAILGPGDDFEYWPDHVVEYTSKVDILICTPGRLVDHITSTKGFHLHHVQWLVIDEADRLLDESFQQWVNVVVPQLEYLPPLDALEKQLHNTFHIPHQRNVRKIILSATMTRDVSKLTSLKLRRPRLVVLEDSKDASELLGDAQENNSHQGESIHLPLTLYEAAMAVAETADKPLYLLQLLQNPESGQQPVGDDEDAEMTNVSETSDEVDSDRDSLASDSVSREARKRSRLSQHDANGGSLVFANSNENALRLARLLTLLLPERQIRALTKSPGDRQGRKTLQLFRKGEISVVVATDLASRGLDIPDLAHVINYDLPTSLNSYVHRVGRTARAGKEGKATTLVEHKQAKWFWNEIARTRSIIRARKVARMDGGLQAGAEERARYEHALEELGKEAMGKRL